MRFLSCVCFTVACGSARPSFKSTLTLRIRLARIAPSLRTGTTSFLTRTTPSSLLHPFPLLLLQPAPDPKNDRSTPSTPPHQLRNYHNSNQQRRSANDKEQPTPWQPLEPLYCKKMTINRVGRTGPGCLLRPRASTSIERNNEGKRTTNPSTSNRPNLTIIRNRPNLLLFPQRVRHRYRLCRLMLLNRKPRARKR